MFFFIVKLNEMPTINQLVRYSRKLKRVRVGNSALGSSPQRKGICTRVYVTSPVKPNSANRPLASVKLSNGCERSVYIPGESHNIQEHSVVLVVGGGAQDVSGNSLSCVRGAYDLQGVEKRRQSRSLYGTKKQKL
jgi:small subunit ribosomal protein S12